MLRVTLLLLASACSGSPARTCDGSVATDGRCAHQLMQSFPSACNGVCANMNLSCAPVCAQGDVNASAVHYRWGSDEFFDSDCALIPMRPAGNSFPFAGEFCCCVEP
jgi:hypothetical protein